MGSKYTYQCDQCDYIINTSGPWEFYRDTAGRMRPYGHPVPRSETARKRGIKGLRAEMYCVHCDKTYKIILYEKSRREMRVFSDIWSLWRQAKGSNAEREVKCPGCGRDDMLLKLGNIREVFCPRCKRGQFRLLMELIS